jgi:HAD superfamily hydrolase (TIGR01509 family)
MPALRPHHPAAGAGRSQHFLLPRLSALRYNAVLLDMGGVLIDFAGGGGLPVGRFDWRGREALARYLSARGRKTSLDDLENVLFAPWRAEHEKRYERGRDASWRPHLRRLRRHAGVRTRGDVLLGLWFRPFSEQLKPLAGARHALGRLRARDFKLALISNVPLPGGLYLEILERHGLGRHFDSFHFSYDEGSRKPSPAMLRSALAKLETPPGFALMVGDRPAVDIAAGRSAGTATAWIESSYREGPRADLELASVADLPDRLL